MTSNRLFTALLFLNLLILGCAGKQVNIDLTNPVYEPKSGFETRYGFLITPTEREFGYTLDYYPELSESIRPFDHINTLEEFIRFEKHFWTIRDTDPRTPENEFKDLIDSRIRDIENEIFAMDLDIPGTRFDSNGGLKGDLARVYLLFGEPNYKFKLSEGIYHVEMVTWYYLDVSGRVMMRFLFYKKFDKLIVFRRYSGGLLDLEWTLKEISRVYVSSPAEYASIWEELLRNDVERVFIVALTEFSPYSDIIIEGGNDKKFGALDPPEPAALTAERFKPTVLGQPDISEETEIFYSDHHSIIPAHFRVGPDSSQLTFMMLIVLHQNLDWEKGDDVYAARLNLRISFQNKKTLKLTEFFTGFKKEISQKDFEARSVGTMVIFPTRLEHWDGVNFTLTLRELLRQFEPGNYVVNIYLQHTLTKKYNAWQEEITIN